MLWLALEEDVTSDAVDAIAQFENNNEGKRRPT